MPGKQNEPRRQHMVSKVLLRQFTENDLLVSHNLIYGSSKPQHPSQVGWQDNFITARRGETEELWARTEGRSARALDAVADGSILEKPREMHALRELIALHFMLRDIVSSVERAVTERVLAAYRPSIGLGPLQPLLVKEAERRVREEAPEVHTDTQQRLFRRACAQLEDAGLEVSFTGDEPVLLADQPLVSLKDFQPGFYPFVAAQTHVLPIGPRHYVSLGRESIWRHPSDAEVRWLNTVQVRIAKQNVFYSPRDRLALHPFVIATRPPQRR